MSAGRRVAVIGCGSIGLRHLRSLARRPDVEAWAHDPVPERLGSAVDLGARAARDLSDLEAARPDVVFVCTPASTHEEVALWAIHRGCDVFVEKPLSIDARSARRIAAEADRRGRRLAVGYMLRSDPALRTLRSAVRDGSIGRVLGARSEFAQYLPDWRPGRDYRETPSARAAMGGGILLEASHEIDAALWIFGRPRRAWAALRRVGRLQVDVEDTVVAVLEMEGGALIELHLDFVQRGYRRELRVAGDAGAVTWRLREGAALTDASGSSRQLAPPTDPDELYRAEVRAFLDPPSEGDRLASGADGVAVLEVVDALRRSDATGRWVDL